MISWLIGWLFACRHRGNLSRVFTNRQTHETYVLCLDCGTRLLYDWQTARITRMSA